MKRLHYLDNLMIFLSVLVVLHHVAVGYGTMGGWCYVTPEKMTGAPQIILSSLFGIEATFSMSLFFFISAYLSTHSLEKKGAGAYIKNRLIRLMIPLLLVMVLLAPSLLYYIEMYNDTTQLSWLEYVYLQNINAPNTSHTWFILVLLVFEILYLLYWKYIRTHFSMSHSVWNAVPSHFSIAAFVLACSALTIALRMVYPLGNNFIGLQFANFVPYVFMYALGILVSRKGWLEPLAQKVAKSWFVVSLIPATFFCYTMYRVLKEPSAITNFVLGLHWESVTLAFVETFLFVGFSGFLLYFFKINCDGTNIVLSKMRENRYGVYIFHAAVVVGITIALEHFTAPPIVKFFLASLLSILCSYLLVGLLRYIPLVKRVI